MIQVMLRSIGITIAPEALVAIAIPTGTIVIIMTIIGVIRAMYENIRTAPAQAAAVPHPIPLLKIVITGILDGPSTVQGAA